MVQVLVIGAGAAGITAAIRAAQGGARVVLLNAHPRPGLKVLMSGGTRCNVTHAVVDERDFFGGSRRAVGRVLRGFDLDATLRWFNDELGVRLVLEPGGKYFPVRGKAQEVLDALLAAAARAGVECAWGERAVRLERAADGSWRAGTEHITSSAALDAPAGAPAAWRAAERVVLATGGLSFPRTGSDGGGYALALAQGHTLVDPVPALAPLTARDLLCTAAQGVTLPAELSLWSRGRRAVQVAGSFLFAHFGVTGPAALDLSRHWHRADPGDRRVTLSLLPGETRESIGAAWLAEAARTPSRGVRSFVAARVPERIAAFLVVEAGLDGVALSQAPRPRRAALIDALVARDLGVTGTLGFEKAEVTAGGIALAEVDPLTLASRRAPGLFLCGEMLDVDGRLGGFNFQWAWSSGTVAGRAAGTIGAP